MARADVGAMIDATRSLDAEERRWAVREFCACRIKTNHREAWDRVLELTADSNLAVRRNALHVLVDGSPREHVRKILARYRRTGQVNLNLH